jgi:palmitoyltransferase
MFMLIYIIAFAIGLAVTAMMSWHLWLISQGQTSVENHDASHYRKMATSRGEVSPALQIDLLSYLIGSQKFVNAYSLGAKRNFALFFNITPTGQYVIIPIQRPAKVHIS